MHPRPSKAQKSPKARVNPTLLALSRTLHIYLTMLGLLVLMLFGVTGFTLNHEELLGGTPRTMETKGQMPKALIAANDSLHLVENLRQDFRITGAMTSFENEDDEITVAFKAPGRIWDATIVKATGETTVQSEAYGLIVLLDNLHRGRNTGPAWSLLIDFSAALIVLACVTGFIMWLVLPKRRKLGVVMIALGAAATLAVAYFLVPGPDLSVKPGANASNAPGGRP